MKTRKVKRHRKMTLKQATENHNRTTAFDRSVINYNMITNGRVIQFEFYFDIWMSLGKGQGNLDLDYSYTFIYSFS